MAEAKRSCIIFLENHRENTSLQPYLKELDLEGKVAILTENRPYSKQAKALQGYAKALQNNILIQKSDLLHIVENSQDYFQFCFERQIELIEHAMNTKTDFRIVPLDVRSSKKIYARFKEEDLVFPELLANAPKLEQKKIDFFEEHAFGAWYVRKKINELEKQGFNLFIYSVGYSHYASLAYYLKDKNLKIIPLESKYEDISYFKMLAFFLLENRGKYCLHCGNECS